MTATTTEAIAALPPADAPPRRNVALVGTIFSMAAAAMLIAGLLASYFGARQSIAANHGVWLDKSVHLPNLALAISYLSLLMSSFTAQWAVSAIRMNDRRQANVAIGLTLLLAAAFINGLTFAWGRLHLHAGDGAFADHMYAVTVGHLGLVIVAMVLFVVVGFRTLGGQFGPRNSEFVASAAAFWHLTVFAGLAVWWCVWFLVGGPTSRVAAFMVGS
jgi:heme/copper-type cytochrome/quinol oxidase subunit 3